MEITGATARKGHQFSFRVGLDYDSSPRGWRRSPYGFRFTSGSLDSPEVASAFTDPFDLLDTIAQGRQAPPLAPASPGGIT